MRELSTAGAATLLGVACLTIMVGCVLVPGLETIAPALGVSQGASWLITLPSLGVVLFGALAGRTIDRFGAWRSLSWGLFLYGLLGSSGVFLHGMPALILNRLLLGGATALVMAAGTSLLSTFYQGEARLKMIARQGMSIELGGVIFLFIGGVLTTLSWRWPFALYLVAWLLLLMLWRWVPRPLQTPPQEKAQNTRSKAAPLRPVRLAALLSMISFFTAVILIPQFFSQQQIGPAETGYFLSFISLIAVVAAAVMPEVIAALGAWRTLIAAFCCYLCAHLIFAFAITLPIFILGGVLLGIGFGLSIPTVNHLTVDLSEERARGRNLAALSVAIFSGQFSSSLMLALPGDISSRFVGAAGVSGLAIAIFALHSRRQAAQADAEHDIAPRHR